MVSAFWKNHILAWLPVYMEMEEKYGITPSVFLTKLLDNRGEPDMVDIEQIYVCIMSAKEKCPEWYEEIKDLISPVFRGPTLHSVRRIDGKAVLFCGEIPVSHGKYDDVNFATDACSNCGMAVETFGLFPDKIIKEHDPKGEVSDAG